MGSSANSLEENMRTTLLLLFICMEAVYMKTYVIETKTKIENALPTVVSDDHKETGADYTDNYEYENGADYTDNYDAGQDYQNGWTERTVNEHTTVKAAPVPTTPTPTTKAPCILSGWGVWIKEKPCGQTRQQRSRTCKRGAHFCAASECSGILTDVQAVTLEECCKWSSWGQWAKPTNMCVPFKITRERTCISNVAGHNCNNQCSGNVREEKTMPGNNCCTWSEWRSGSCSVSCGTGTQQRTRSCSYGGTACATSKCQGEGSANSQCSMAACPVVPAKPVTTGTGTGTGGPSWG